MPVSKTRGRRRKNPKRISTPVMNGEAGMEDADVDVEGTPGPPAPRVQPRKRGRPPKYRLASKVEVTEEDTEGDSEVVEQGDNDEEEAGEEVENATPNQSRGSRKRKRERDMDTSLSIPRVRLRLPTTRNSVKGKEKEDSEVLGGFFDGVLNLEDGDTSRTSIVNNDKQLFEKSRLEAEVRRRIVFTICNFINFVAEKARTATTTTLRYKHYIQQRLYSIFGFCFRHIHS
jgi:hypothetical protein